MCVFLSVTMNYKTMRSLWFAFALNPDKKYDVFVKITAVAPKEQQESDAERRLVKRRNCRILEQSLQAFLNVLICLKCTACECIIITLSSNCHYRHLPWRCSDFLLSAYLKSSVQISSPFTLFLPVNKYLFKT